MEKVVDMLKKYGFIALMLYVFSMAVNYVGQGFNSTFIAALGWFLTLALIAAFYGLIIWARMTKIDKIAKSLSVVAIAYIGIDAFLNAFMNLADMPRQRWFVVIYFVLGLIYTIVVAGLFVLFMAKKLFDKTFVPFKIIKFILFGVLGLSLVIDTYAFIVDIVVGTPWFMTMSEFATTFLIAGLFGDAYTLFDETMGGESSKAESKGSESSETKELPPEENKTEKADA